MLKLNQCTSVNNKGGFIMRKNIWIGLLILTIALVGCQSDPESKNDSFKSNENQEKNNNTENQKNTDSKEVKDIEGTLWEADGDSGVILSHGAVYDADSWEEQGAELAENGMTTFAVEDTSTDDIISAAKMLKSKYDVKHLSIIGASAGATGAIDATIDTEIVFDKIILLSPSGQPNDIEDIPVLVIYSEEEGFEGLESDKNENIETVEMPGSAHAQELFMEKDSAEETMNYILDFIKED